MIHFRFPGFFGKIVQVLCRVGVPIFFMCSGYYLKRKELNSRTISKKIKHILYLFLSSAACYILFNTFLKGYRYVLTDVTFANLVKFFVFNAPQISSAHLWFLSALIYSYLIVYLICMTVKEKYHLSIAVILLSLHVVIAEVTPQFGFQIGHPLVRNAYFFGVPFLLIGVWLSEHMGIVRRIGSRLLVCLVLGGSILAIIENSMLSPDDLLELYIGNIIASVSLFTLCIKYPNKKCGNMYLLGKNFSLGIYVLHPMIGTVIGMVIEKMRFTIWIIEWIKPLLVVLFSLLAAIAVNRIRVRKDTCEKV